MQLTQCGDEGLGNCFFFDARAARGFIFRLVPKVLPFKALRILGTAAAHTHVADDGSGRAETGPM